MWPRWLGDVLRPAQADADLDEEIRFHLERRTEELVAGGGAPGEGAAGAPARNTSKLAIACRTPSS